MIYVRTPSDEELQELRRMTRSEIERVAPRAQMILHPAQLYADESHTQLLPPVLAMWHWIGQ